MVLKRQEIWQQRINEFHRSAAVAAEIGMAGLRMDSLAISFHLACKFLSAVLPSGGPSREHGPRGGGGRWAGGREGEREGMYHKRFICI